jgi:transcriptional regulator with PAS, ATPase and Fis domain
MDAALICDSEKSQSGAIASFLFDVPGGKQDPNSKSSTPRPRWRGTSYTSDTQNKVDLNSAKDAPRYFHLLSDRDLLELRAIAEVIVQRCSEIVGDSYQKYLVHFGDSATLSQDEFTYIFQEALQRSQWALFGGDIDKYAAEVSRLGEVLATQRVTLDEVIAVLQLFKESVNRVLRWQDQPERLATALDKLTHVQISLLVSAYARSDGATGAERSAVIQSAPADLTAADKDRFHGLVGAAPSMRQLYRRIEAAATSRANLMIVGESGTGKELVARAVHECSARAERPFVALNCAALPKDLIESELFGYKRGAFSGATSEHPGCSGPQTAGPYFSTKSLR